MTHAELIAALESATGPSRELDAGIAKSVGWRNIRVNWWPPEEVAKARRKKASLWSCDRGPLPLPDYTASIDAALLLVPADHGWMVMGTAAKCGAYAANGATPAIALCIAALKVRKETT
jgi:hypothetical protein